MKTRYLWFGLIVLILAGVLILPYLAGNPVRTRTTTTMAILAEILTDVDLLSHESMDQLRQAAENGKSSIALNRRLGDVFTTCGDKDITAARFLSRDGLFLDAWGTPLLFMPTNSNLYERINSELKDKNRILVVWSAGPNRTNEFGAGDDIISHR